MATATDLEHLFTGGAARLELNSTEQAVLAVIAANRNHNGICELTRREIGDLCNSSQRTVSRAVAVLTAKDIVSRKEGWVVRRHQPDWYFQKSGWHINSATLEGDKANKPKRKPKKTTQTDTKKRTPTEQQAPETVALANKNLDAARATIDTLIAGEHYSGGTSRAERRRAEKAARKAARKKGKK